MPLPVNYLSDIQFGAEDKTMSETGPDAGSFLLEFLYWHDHPGAAPTPDLSYILGGTAELGAESPCG